MTLSASMLKSSKKIERIVIVGGGITGWTVAAGLVNGLRGLGVQIALVDISSQLGMNSHTEATTPACVAFHQWLGISEFDLISKTGASFLLATEFKSWSDQRQHYFMPFNDHGFMLNRIDFSQYAISRYINGYPLNYDDYSLASVAARYGRFCHPSTKESSIFSSISYGLTLNNNAYKEYLQAYAINAGVVLLHSDIGKVKLDDQNNIESIFLIDQSIDGEGWVDANNNLEADLFVDCSGIAAQLIEIAMQVEWCPLKNSFPSLGKQSPVTHILKCSQALPTGKNIPVARLLQQAGSGWIQTNTTQTQIERQYFYHSDFISHDEACDELNIDPSLAESCELKLGRRANFWSGNCIAIGESVCNPDQNSVGNLHLTQSAVWRLLSVFPASIDSVFSRKEYNRLTHVELDHIEDFHTLHYRVAQTKDSKYWKSLVHAKLSNSLLHKLELFSARGLIPFYENETFPSGVWVSLLLGNGFWPRDFDPLIRSMDQKWIELHLEKMKSMMKSATEKMLTQVDYINRAQHKNIQRVNG